MATQQEIESTYDYMDEIFRSSLGEFADITCAWFDGDYGKSLATAQEEKHARILSALEFQPGHRILDIGCGWGPLLHAVRRAGGVAVGLTLSPRQAKHCRDAGFEVHLLDWRKADIKKLGKFDAIASVGAFEHFCSESDYFAGKQEDTYAAFFEFAADALSGKYLFLQTMVWGSNKPDTNQCKLSAPKGSNESVVAHMREFYPGSFLPSGLPQITRSAGPRLELVSVSNGRMDYIETLGRWDEAVRSNPRLPLLAMKLVPRYLRSREFRTRIRSMRYGYNRQCFVRDIFDHLRLVFRLRDT